MKESKITDISKNKKDVMLPKIHKLKIKDQYYQKMISGNKKAEIRFNDRNYKIGDIIYFNNISSNYTDYMESKIKNISFEEVKHTFGSMVTLFVITDVLDDFEGLTEGFVMLSLATISIGINNPAVAASNNYVDRQAAILVNTNWNYIQGFLKTLTWVRFN